MELENHALLSVGWTKWLASNELNTAKVDGMSLSKLGLQKDCGLHLIFPFWLWWKPDVIFWTCGARCYLLPCGEVHIARNWGRSLANSQQEIRAVIPTTYEELNLTNNYVREVRSICSLSWAVRWDNSLAAMWESLRQRHSEMYEIINICCFKLLSFAVICYTATDN